MTYRVQVIAADGISVEHITASSYLEARAAAEAALPPGASLAISAVVDRR